MKYRKVLRLGVQPIPANGRARQRRHAAGGCPRPGRGRSRRALEVRRAPQPLPGVSVELAVWAGNELTHVLTPDPADLKDLAAETAAEDDDALF